MANETIYPYGQNNPMPGNIGIADDLNTNRSDQALSARAGKRLGDKVFGELSPIELSSLTQGNWLIVASTNKWSEDSSYPSVMLPIVGGTKYIFRSGSNGARIAILKSNTQVDNTFPDYSDYYFGRIVIQPNDEMGIVMPYDAEYVWILVSSAGADITPSVFEQISQSIDEQIDGISSQIKGTELIAIPTFGNFISTTQPIKWASVGTSKGVVIPVEAGGRYLIKPNPSCFIDYAVLTSNSRTDGTEPSFAEGYIMPIRIEVGSQQTITIPSDGRYLYLLAHYGQLDTIASVTRLVSGGILDEVEDMLANVNTKSKIPQLMRFSGVAPTQAIYTIDNFVLAHEYDENQGTDNLKFSNDLGKTWVTVANTYGTILNAFMFADGTFMMATKKAEGCRIYWTRDFSTFTEATIIDYDGQPYVMETGKTRFFILKPVSTHTYVNNIEYYCFWDYILSGAGTSSPRMWYAISDESGVTVRAAFCFNISTIEGETLRARHGHFFGYNKHDGYFYALTGDGSNECHVIRGRHDANHQWTWEHLATGDGYKLVSVKFDEGNLYAVTDYTDSSLNDAKGFVSIPTSQIHLTTTHGNAVFPAKLRYLYHAPNNSNALSNLVTDNHGWRVAITDYAGGSKHPIAKGNHNFVWVDNDSGLKIHGLCGPNAQGDVLASVVPAGYSYPSDESWLKLSHMTYYNLTEVMRNSGATDFFDGYVGIPY